jgi:hypothetical protein
VPYLCVCIYICVSLSMPEIRMLLLPLGGINSGGDKRRRVVIELFKEKKLGDRIVISSPPFTAGNIQRYYDDICVGLLL